MTIYQHFRPEEKDFIDQVHAWRNDVENTYAPKLTDFLDPREQKIVSMIIGQNMPIKFGFSGGAEEAERKRAIIYPDYFEVEQDDFQLALLEIDYSRKFITIEHPQVLGSVMSMGLARGKFGDILIKEGRIQLIVCEEMKDYVRLQLDSIGKAKVQLKEEDWDNVLQTEENWTETSTTLSSLRLDAVIAGIYNISRQKAQLFITQGLTKVNFSPVEQVAFICEEGDVLSVRGQGRSILKVIEGKTKKDKWRVVIGKIK
ncbi:YlmH family RNA-binding protein [Niallia sp. 03133]|uniref:YlmH family RNA-binding protein n=1 Tax=Niallia sp. 03133 TaxID=3458060 RepID=UPI00404448D9